MSTLRVNTIQNSGGTGSPEINGLARAWVNFNGTGTVAIRQGLNVSSITDNGTGDYTVNFTNSLVDSSMAFSISCSSSAASGPGTGLSNSGTSSSGIRVITFNDVASKVDPNEVSVVVFR